MLPQILTGIFVAICCLIVTGTIKTAAKKLENIATKDYVREELAEQSRQLGDIFVNAISQNHVNSVIDNRLKYLEDNIWVRFQQMIAMAYHDKKENI